jgi:CDP-glucose 4,6-dehydratase
LPANDQAGRAFGFLRGRTVVVTGHTGFKGSWLTAWLHALGAHVVGIALDPPTQPSHFEAARLGEIARDQRVDIRDRTALDDAIRQARPDVLFHLAAQPLVRRSYADPVETYSTNVLGTLHVLEALRALDRPCVAVIITSDKCYDNVEWVWGYRETDRLGGPDPYSASKGAAELVIRSHVRSFFAAGSPIRVGVGRAGNVVGGGDWAADRIVPDCVRAWSRGEVVDLRNPHATRPWQHVLEPLSGYLALAEALFRRPELHGEAFNFGPPPDQDDTVLQLVGELSRYWGHVQWREPADTASATHESGLLKLNCDKALHVLRWRAVLDFKETAQLTSEWYRAYYAQHPDIGQITRDQISQYVSWAAERGLAWAQGAPGASVP